MQIVSEQYGFDGERTHYAIELDTGHYINGSVMGRQNLSELITREIMNIEVYGKGNKPKRLRELLEAVA